MPTGADRNQLGTGKRLDLDEEVRQHEPAHAEQRLGRACASRLDPLGISVIVLEKAVDIRREETQRQDVAAIHPGLLEYRIDIR